MSKKLMMLAVAVAAAFGAWADTETVGGYTWTYRTNGGTAEIYGTSSGWSLFVPCVSPEPTGAVAIPSTLGGKPVTSIGSSAFEYCDGLASVTIPNSVTSIGESAFKGCYGLASVTIPDSVTNIGEYAFYGCDGLASVTIPDSVTSIEESAFEGCSGLASVTIPNSVTSIGYGAFAGCYGLTSVMIPDSVVSIGNRAFSGCSGFVSFTVGEGNVEYKSVNGLLLSKDGKTLVAGVNGNVTIPDGVTSIGDWAFSFCHDLASVTIPNSVTNIGDYAFCDCDGLASVTIPDSITSIGGFAFEGCHGLASVNITNLAKWCGISFSDNRATPLFYAQDLYLNGKKVTDLMIPDGVTSIGERAFCGCDGLASVTIPNSVTSIGESAFKGCYGLASVTIPDSVTNIGEYAFYGCDGLATVHVEPGDAKRMEALLEASYCDVSQLTFVEGGAMYKLALKSNSTTYGTVSGGGNYGAGAKATLKAKANSGYVFAGWFKDKSCKKALNPKGYDNRNPTVKYEMPTKNTTVYAKFVTKAADKKSLKFSSATKKLANTPAKATAGKSFSLALGLSSASLPTVTAKDLPKGLEIDKATGEITGKATVPGSFIATVTVKNSAGNKITQKVKMTVSVPSWAKGTFYGTAKPDGKTLSYLKFTVAETGKVSGKVTYSGKAYSFTSKYKSCTAKKATFAPTVNVGSKTFNPGTVTVKTQKLDGLSLVEAASSKGTFAAQKTANLVKKGKPLAALVGKTFTFTKEDADSGLTKGKDKLTVKLASGDAVTVSGTVGGKELTALSWVTLVSGVESASETTTYTLYVDIINAKLKYERTLTVIATAGSNGTEAEAFFGEASPPPLEGQLWKGGPCWADRNIGADSPEDCGLYFWWGDTTGHRPSGATFDFDSSFDFDFSEGNPAIYTCGKSESELQGAGWITSDGVLAPEHDAAHVHWGGDWRMPTQQEMYDLAIKCDWTETTQNGVNGYVVRGRGAYASNSIFFPCVGLGHGTSLYSAGSYGHYWSSVPSSGYDYYAWGLGFDSSILSASYYGYRADGQPIRPVQGVAK
ncbi:MAG: leucine-rich repeat protein [Kiritimatiellae bacterium]|nr:leucine-rich repeat protein [Kiritimatiellia bacterium]